MAFYSFITDIFKPKPEVITKQRSTEQQVPTINLKQLMGELGVRTSNTIGTYDEEENPDALKISDYIAMQNNDGTVRAITRLFAMPVQSTPIKIIPDTNDHGEADFIRSVFLKPAGLGGMTTSLPFVIADMTRAIFEGFRLYEKVPQIIKVGPYKGKIGWRKLAPRDAITLTLRSDEHGGFMGAHQTAVFGSNLIDVNIPPEKCILFTFQKEQHVLYGESILKTAHYHYDKKHKLYYLAHKKAENDAIGLKILRINKTSSESDVNRAEEAVDQIGANTRVTLPSGFDLEIDRATSGYDVLNLIEHHDSQMALSTLTQATQLGTKQKYGYTYGSGFTTQSEYVYQMLQSVMKNMEDTLNIWAVAPLIDYNFGSGSYPKIKLMPIKGKTQEYLMSIFEAIIRKDPTYLSSEFIQKLTKEAAESLGLEVTDNTSGDALKAFESGKLAVFNKRKLPAVPTRPEKKKEIYNLAGKSVDNPYFLEHFESLGREFALNIIANNEQ